MIRVTLELVPGGVGEPEYLGMIEIDNQISHTLVTKGKRGDYAYRVYKKRRGVIAASGLVRNFPRLSYHPWNLIRRILNDVEGTI